MQNLIDTRLLKKFSLYMVYGILIISGAFGSLLGLMILSYYLFDSAYQMYNHYRDKTLPTKKYINFIAQGYRENKIPLKQLTNALQERLSRHKNKS